jgi:signal transduction histidine kinase
VFPTEIFRTAQFRLAVAFTAAVAVVSMVLCIFLTWQTVEFRTARIDRYLESAAEVLAVESPDEIDRAVARQLAGNLIRVSFVGLFSPSGERLAGNLRHLPANLPVDGHARRVSAAGIEPYDEFPVVRAVARRVPNGNILVIARDIDVLGEVRAPLLQALELGLIPALLLSLGTGALLSRRALDRVKAVHERIERIMSGDLHERLPTRGTRDDLDRLAASVNRMLDQIERLLHDVKGVGDNIAHDLRTPLARARAKLERGSRGSQDLPALRAVAETAVGDLDQAIGIITALLRIGEIESGRRRSGFGDVRLADLAREVFELYQPVSEEGRIELALDIQSDPVVRGDGELLLEAVANLVDNAMKFTPPRGRVRVVVGEEAGQPAIRVEDNGPGIPPAEREVVMRRFYRAETSRHTSGNGLGLSIVGAIVQLHDFRLILREPARGSGVVFAIVANAAPVPRRPRPGTEPPARQPPRLADAARAERSASPVPADAAPLIGTADSGS